MENYKINELFEIAFGIKSVGTYKNVNLQEGTDYATKLSALGTPMIVPIKFKGKGYQVFNDFGDIVLDTYADFDLPASTLVNLRRSKIIQKTKVSGVQSTVKEIFAFDDWQIDIRGFCLADASHPTAKTAREQRKKLYSFDKIVQEIKVVSELFNDFDISHLTIDEMLFTQLKGKPGVIPFYLRCSSDEPSDLFF